MTDKSLILNHIKEHLNIKTNKEFADFLGIKPTALSMWRSRNTFDIELIFNKCEGINPLWLLTGKGEMLLNEEGKAVSSVGNCIECEKLKEKIALLEQIIEAKSETIKALQSKDSNGSSKRQHSA